MATLVPRSPPGAHPPAMSTPEAETSAPGRSSGPIVGAPLGRSVPARLDQQPLQCERQPLLAGVEDRQRQAQVRGSSAGRVLETGSGVLAQPHHALVLTEVVVTQLRVSVESQLGQDRPLEGPDQEVGEQVGARLVLEELLDRVRAREEVVAVEPRQPVLPARAAQRVESAVAAAIGVPDRHRGVTTRELGCQLVDPVGDPVGLVVEQRRKGEHVHAPAVATDELGARLGDGAAGDQRQRPRTASRLRRGRRGGRRTGR